MNKHIISLDTKSNILYIPEEDRAFLIEKKSSVVKSAITSIMIKQFFHIIMIVVGTALTPLLFKIKYNILIYTIASFVVGAIYYKFYYFKSMERVSNQKSHEIDIVELKGYVHKIVGVTVLAVIFCGYIAYMCIGILTNYEEQPGIYVMALIIYSVMIPILLININFKGRFILLKRLKNIK